MPFCNVFSHKTIYLSLLYLMFILRYQILDQDQNSLKWIELCLQDFQNCPQCFSNADHQTSESICQNFVSNFEILPMNVKDGFNGIFSFRNIQRGVTSSGKDVIVKYLNKEGKSIGHTLDDLKNHFIDGSRIEGLILCPQKDKMSLDHFVSLIKSYNIWNEYSILTLLNVNAHSVLTKILTDAKFPVAQFIASQGFIVVETNEGDTLQVYYGSHIKLRLKIAKQLLEAALMFTEGISGFRFYMTDINPDNIVVKNERISFIDLDNLIILDGQSNKLVKKEHVHSKIDCEGCFAYSQEDLCAFERSDINIYAVCQLLYEDLNSNIQQGFLYQPNTEEADGELSQLLKQCVYCDKYPCDRFSTTNLIIQRIESHLQ